MPRYFFTIDGDTKRDVEGYDIPDLATAKCEAVKMAGVLICDSAGTFWNTKELCMTVTNEQGLTLFTLEFVAHEAPALMR